MDYLKLVFIHFRQNKKEKFIIDLLEDKKHAYLGSITFFS